MEPLFRTALLEYNTYCEKSQLDYFHNIDHDLSKDDTYKCILVKSFDEGVILNDHFQNTIKCVNDIFKENYTFQIFFAIMEGAKFMAPHKNKDNNTFYRFQLGLQVDEDDDGTLTVRRKQYKWKEKESVVFDTTKTHCVYKSKDYTRVLLVVDFDKTQIPTLLDKSVFMI